MRVEWELELLTDVSVPPSARTLGGASTLQYIPGRALWGAAADAAYRSGVASSEAFRLFHQGAVRFFDALPAFGQARCVPTPLSWQKPKFGAVVIRNVATAQGRELASERQHTRLDDAPWRAPDGTPVYVELRHSLRTAVTSEGKADAGLLFGIRSMVAGTVLRGGLEGREADVARVQELLGTEVRVGHSRSAEFGRVRLRVVPAGPGLRGVDGKATEIRFLCVTRLALRDAHTGLPTFTPDPAAFGLPGGWVFDPEASQLRTSRYSPYNAHRRRPELERQVIDPGAVLSFRAGSGATAVDLGELRAWVGRGVGEWVHEGLGEVVAEPQWLASPTIELPVRGAQRCGGAPAAAPPAPTGELFAWASRRASERRASREALRWAYEKALEFDRFRLPPSQWGEVHRLAREARFRTGGAAWLIDQLARHLSGTRALSWAWGARARGTTAGDYLLSVVRPLGDDAPIRIELLASAAMREREAT